MRFILILTLVGGAALVAGPTQSAAQVQLPPAVERGLHALEAGRPDSAVIEWTKTWTSPDDNQKRDQLVASFRRLAEIAGAVRGYDIVRVIDLTPHLRRVYILLLCEIQPAYVMLVAYQPAGQWRVTAVNWNTDQDKVLPASVIALERPGP